jgi:hypothetical protein
MNILLLELHKECLRLDGKVSNDIESDFIKIILDNELEDAVL